METLRFLMITSHFPPSNLGGDAVYVKYLSTELVRRGHEVSVLYNPASYQLMRGSSIRAEELDGVKAYANRSRLGRFDPVVALVIGQGKGSESRIRETIGEVRPDVVHWHNTKGFFGRPFQIPDATTAYTAHDYYAVCPRSNLIKPDMSVCRNPHWCQLCLLRWKKPPQLWRVGHNRVISLTRDIRVLTPSDFMGGVLEAGGIHVSRTLRNFAPTPRATPAGERDPGLLMYLGMLELHKGPLTLLEAFAKSREAQGFNLWIVGEGSTKARIARTIDRYGLSNRVMLPGFLPQQELNALRARVGLQIIPSEWHENAPLVVLEAFALGIPVIGSDLGGLPEILTPESGSMTFRGGDVDSLAETLVRSWEERSSLSRRGSLARKAYLENYTPDIHYAEYRDALG